MPPKKSTTKSTKPNTRGRGRGQETDVGQASQSHSFLGFAVPTFASRARSSASASTQGVVVPPEDIVMGVPDDVTSQQDIEMRATPSRDDPLTEVGDVDMENADAPAPVVRLPPTVPAQMAPTSPTVAAQVAPTPPTVLARAQPTMEVQSLLAALPMSKEDETKAKMARIRARAAEVAAAKRRRQDSTEDSGQPSAAKKQQMEKPSEQQIEAPAEHQGAEEAAKELAIVQEPFPYTEVDYLLPQFCCLRVGDGPIIGGFKRQDGWGAKISIDAGTKGVHAFTIDLVCNIVDKSSPLKGSALDIDTISMIWYAGAHSVPDNDNAPYQLEDFEMLFPQEHPGHNAANDSSILEACPEKLRMRLTYCRFKSNEIFFNGSMANFNVWEGLDRAVLREIKKLMMVKGLYVEVWFINPLGSSASFETKVLNHLRRAYQERLPILSQYGVLNLEGTRSIKDIGAGMYCKYPTKSEHGSKKKVEDRSQEPIGFHSLPTPTFYRFHRELEIYNALIPIRESQFQKGLSINVEIHPVRVFLMSLTGVEVKDRAQFDLMTPAQRRFHKTFYAFIRMPGQKGQKELAPAPGVRIQLEWDNSDPKRQKAHAPVKLSHRWNGIVIPHQGTTVTATGTDFCVLLTMPDAFSRVPIQPYLEAKYLPTKDLPLAHLKTKFSNLTYERQLEAWLAFCNSQRPPIALMREILSSHAYRKSGQVTVTNVAGGPFNTEESEQRYFELVDRFEREKRLDESQIHALRESAKVPNHARILQGPPGTGKTWAAVHLTWALVNAGHKVLFVAPTNVAVDSATTTLIRARPTDMAHHQVIRVEATALSMGEITKYIDYDDMERLDQPGIEKPLPAPEADPVLQQLVDDFEASLDVEADVDFEKYEAQTKSFSQAYELALNAYKARAQDYPVEASMDFNVWKTCKDDFNVAARRERNKRLVTPHNITELLTSEETESSAYTKAVQDYIHHEGKLPKGAAKAFMKLRVEQEARNISKASVICTTSSSAGAEILAAKFNPTIIVLDEVGLMTAPDMAVPLMTFKNWIASYHVGDPQQLTPLNTAERFCEVRGIVEKSVLGIYIDRQYPLLFLDIQYRMDPEIALFPNQIFYDNKLRNAACTEVDNVYKQAIRKVTSKYYGIKGKNGDGSLYMMVDVVYGRGRLEEGGTSLQNYANADAVVEAIKHLIDEGFPRSEIKLLTLYKGQKTVLVSKLVEGIKGDNWVPEDVTTVDSYQGKQGAFACLDMVAATSMEGNQPKPFDDEDDVAVVPSGLLRVEMASSYVTNPHRLCVGITRTTCGLFTFCQTATLVRAYKSNKSDYQNAVFKMVEDAEKRGLIYRDRVHFDTHPTALREVDALDVYNAQLKLNRQDSQQLEFVGKVLLRAQADKHAREQRLSATQKIPEPKRPAPTPSRRAPNMLPQRLTTGAAHSESTPTTPERAEGVVPLTTRPPTQHGQKMVKRSLRDKAVAAQLAEEERTGKKEPEVIPRPGNTQASWSDIMEDAANPRPSEPRGDLESGEESDTQMT